MIRELDEAVKRGAAPSKNSLVERALVTELGAWQRERRRRQWQDAVKDPLFMQDLKAVSDDFEVADAETARRIG